MYCRGKLGLLLTAQPKAAKAMRKEDSWDSDTWPKLQHKTGCLSSLGVFVVSFQDGLGHPAPGSISSFTLQPAQTGFPSQEHEYAHSSTFSRLDQWGQFLHLPRFTQGMNLSLQQVAISRKVLQRAAGAQSALNTTSSPEAVAQHGLLHTLPS